MIGELIGNHRIVRKLGEGGMGEVFLGEHEGIGTHIAIKVLFPHISHDVSQVDRFFNEARAVAQIRHAGIVKITDVGFTQTGRAYLLMEFLDGESLAARILRGPMTPPVACEIARQMASVLAATHATGVIHRDLKPDNVFLVADHELPFGERVKILDFGIAKLTGALARGRPTQSQSQMGTPVYMSPEQWGDASKVDVRADIYSLGCMVFELLCGRPPFEATSIMEAFALHTSTPAPSARGLRPEVSPGLDELLRRMLAKAPADRPQSMQELARTFSELAGSTADAADAGMGTSRPPSNPLGLTPMAVGAPIRRTARTEGRGTGRGWLAVVGIVLVGGGAAVAFVILGGGGAARRSGSSSVTDPATPSPTGDGRPNGEDIRPTRDPLAARPTELGPAPRDPASPSSLRARVEAVDPFVIVGSPPFAAQRGLVSREAYGWYLAGLPPADATAGTPLKDPGGAAPTAPMTWVTYAQAEAFCSAIGAVLPTSGQWAGLAADRGGPVFVGPISEWTAPAEDGVALVREPRDRSLEPEDPLYKSSDAPPGARPESVAGATIGFRCVR